MKGKISVIVITYNQREYIKKSLESVFAQTRKPYEILVVDNGSTDNTQEVLENYTLRIKLVTLKRNRGAEGVLNPGLRAATGDYVIFLPADDWFEPTILEEEGVILDENPDIALVYSQAYTWENRKKYLRVAKPAGEKTIIGRKEFGRLLTEGDFIPFLTAMYRKNAMGKVGYFEELKFFGDWEYYIRLAKQYPFAYIAKPLANYCLHKGAYHLSPNYIKAYEKEFLYILQKHLSGRRVNPKLKRDAYSMYFLRLFIEYLMMGKITRAIHYWQKTLALKPQTIFSYSLWAPFVWKMKNMIHLK